MFRILIAFGVLILSVWAGLQFSNDPGYLMFTFRQYVVEMPLWFAVLALVAGFIVIYAIIRVVIVSKSAISHFPDWLEHRKMVKAWSQTQKGLLALNAGQWRLAERNLLKAANHTNTPLLNYLAAARSAQEQGDHKKRDRYLQLADQHSDKSDLVVELTQAQLQIEEGQLEKALTGLKHLRQLAPYHKTVLTLLQDLYTQLYDWEQLAELIPYLHKAKLISAIEREALEKDTYFRLFKSKIDKLNKDMLEDFWSRLPRIIKRDSQMLALYVGKLIEDKAFEEAESVIRKHLKYYWSEQLILLYGYVKSADKLKQLKRAESWLKQKKSAVAYLTCARICTYNHLWGKARSYYEESIFLAPSADAYKELGDLLNQLGEAHLAQEQYRNGLNFMTSTHKKDEMLVESLT